MCSSTTGGNNGCGEVQELVIWYPGGSLDRDEARRVENHVAECAACADLLRFAGALKSATVEEYNDHPAAETLVDFAENPGRVVPARRAAVRDHLVVCESCREQIDILRRVDEGLAAGAGTDRTVEAAPLPVRERSPRPSFFQRVKVAGWLGPVPATFYLAIAVVALGLHFVPGGTPDDPPPTPSGGGVILPDETDHVRDLGTEGSGPVRVDAAITPYLLLELTGLESPPANDGLYRVVFAAAGSSRPVLTTTIAGRTFRDNYTIVFPLRPGAPPPGDYSVRVVDPGGKTVFRSRMRVE